MNQDSGWNRASLEVSLDWSIADSFAVVDYCDAAVGCKLLLLLRGRPPTSACVAGRGRHV